MELVTAAPVPGSAKHAVLFRRVLGAVLRSARREQQRTLRDVSAAAGISLGYLSEIERGRKEASSELLAEVCAALGVRLADVLLAVGRELAQVEPQPLVVLPVAPSIGSGVGPVEVSVRAAA